MTDISVGISLIIPGLAIRIAAIIVTVNKIYAPFSIIHHFFVFTIKEYNQHKKAKPKPVLKRLIS